MNLLREPVINPLGWALLHFLWQGALIAMILAVLNAALRKRSANARYAAACGALALMLLCAAGTFLWLGTETTRGQVEAAPASALAMLVPSVPKAVSQPAPSDVPSKIVAFLPWLVGIWLAGVAVLSIRSAGGWIVAQRLKARGTIAVDAVWEQRLKSLAERLAVARPVRLCRSAVAEVPTVVGWLRPMILVPASAFAGLDPRQLEALLAHELAHIRRHDYLVNLIQTAAETLLFYHPAVWWVGQRIRIERENCCDDLAVSACGNVSVYARALTELEDLRGGASRFAMAADGGLLLNRIRRLIGVGQAGSHTSRTWLTGALAVLTVLAVWVGAQAVAPSAHGAVHSPAVLSSAAALEPDPDAAPSPAQESANSETPAAEGKGFMAELADAGYPHLTTAELIAFKIHGVTPAYIRQVRAAGMSNLTPDDLVAFRIHGVDPDQIREMQAAGYGKLTADQLVAIRIHGITPGYAKQAKAMGFGDPSLDQLLAMKIHGITPEFANGVKGLGLSGLTIDELIAFRIHNVDAAQVRQLQALGLGKPTADQVLALRIHNITPEFVRSLKDAGVASLTLDDAIAARIQNITPQLVREMQKHGVKNPTVDQLIEQKLGGDSPDDII